MTSLNQVLIEIADLERRHVAELQQIRAHLERLTAPARGYTPAEFAKLCSVSESTVRRAIDAGRIPAIDLGDRSTVIPSWVLTQPEPLHPARPGRAA